jgi:benzoyl-CoA reductase/2-hydroxyglutaryl-CoA dehydratase subunit BcrC/BadD/HgdB
MIVETAGAVIVGEESCVGERGTRNLTDDSGETVDEMLDAIVDRYFQVDCAIFTPNPDRLNHIQEMVTAYKADGVIHYGLQFCQPYLMEAIPVEKALEEKATSPACASKPITAWRMSASSRHASRRLWSNSDKPRK